MSLEFKSFLAEFGGDCNNLSDAQILAWQNLFQEKQQQQQQQQGNIYCIMIVLS
jgi:hypothetical protein